ncbi:hypothetical protein HDU99_002072 [Rhizoclosmatium hyalinum]|nr:hypothetical protein HDU99_002072 [Rhizoclosmatium hyalinum]
MKASFTITLAILAVNVLGDNIRCGKDWSDANAKCGTYCGDDNRVCVNGDKCWAGLQRICSADGTLLNSSGSPAAAQVSAAGVLVTGPITSVAGIPSQTASFRDQGISSGSLSVPSVAQTTLAPNVIAAQSQIEQLFNNSPKCLSQCISNLYGSTTIDAKVVDKLCASETTFKGLNATFTTLNTCLSANCSTADQTNASSFIFVNSASLNSLCQTVNAGNLQGTAISTSTSHINGYQYIYAPNTDAIALGVFGAIVLLSIMGCLLCLHRSQQKKKEVPQPV